MKKQYYLFFLLLISLIAGFSSPAKIQAAPAIGSIAVQTAGDIQLYHKFEISFSINNSTANNFFFPYDPSPPAGVVGTGISVEALFVPPGVTDYDWNTTNGKKITPCFYNQPYEKIGANDNNRTLLPVGLADWRCRFTPEQTGLWHYKVRATDSEGISPDSDLGNFTVGACIDGSPRCKGFIRVSSTDNRFFEYSNGSPFVAPLVNIEDGNPFNRTGTQTTLTRIQKNIELMGNNGVHFVRWFPTGEGANSNVIMFGDDLQSSWAYGDGYSTTDDPDTELGKLFSFRPYFYSTQSIPLIQGLYKLSFRAKVEDEQVIRAIIGNTTYDICSTSNSHHTDCSQRHDGWNSYNFEINSSYDTTWSVGTIGCHVNSDAQGDCATVETGKVRVNSLKFQRCEANCQAADKTWGGNLLARGDPDTYNYVDQIGAARMDELLKESEDHGVYHKLTMFHKNDRVLNRFQSDGTIGPLAPCDWDPTNPNCWTPNNFYSDFGQAARWFEDAYTRYFVSRWAYSTAIHSLELGNECDLWDKSYQAAYHLAELVNNLSPRHLMMSNSFWGYYADSFFNNPEKGYLLDYADKHWYSNEGGSGCNVYDGVYLCEIISNVWSDSAAYVRECSHRLKTYYNWGATLKKPIVRGEGGVTQSGTQPQHPLIGQDQTGTWFHKKTWAHLGLLGFSCDGEWWPRMFSAINEYPNTTYDTFKIFKAYETFINNEALNNGRFMEIGTDLAGTEKIDSSNANIRAWGVRDTLGGRTLVWIDNINDTWVNHANDQTISPASGTITIKGLVDGNYTVQKWDTRSGSITDTTTQSAVGEQLVLTVNDLATDLAVKLIGQEINSPTPTPTPEPCIANTDGLNGINFDDFKLVLANWGNTSNFGNTDINLDNKVNGLDLAMVIKEWGKSCP